MNPRASLLAVLALAAAGCAAGTQPAAQPKARPVFTHAAHKDMVECKDCHAGIDKSTSLATRHIPTTEKCKECHDDKQAPPPRTQESHLTFSHQDHLPRVKGDCTRCHQVLPEPRQTASTVPPMSACTSCHHHQEEYAEARCQPCHVDLKRFPLRPVSGFAHQGDFLRTHGKMAKTDVQTCAVCHDQTKCAECHAATTRPFKAEIEFPEKVEAQFIHRGDYVSRHVQDASADPASCRKCHGSSFCDSCHREQGISPSLPNARTLHPQNWILEHGMAARQNIVSCAGCHDQGPNAICVRCHSTGGVDPHPPGWSSRHSLADVARNSMCRICHH